MADTIRKVIEAKFLVWNRDLLNAVDAFEHGGIDRNALDRTVQSVLREICEEHVHNTLTLNRVEDMYRGCRKRETEISKALARLSVEALS